MIGGNYVRKENIWKCFLGKPESLYKYEASILLLQSPGCEGEYFNAIITQYICLKQYEPEENC